MTEGEKEYKTRGYTIISSVNKKGEDKKNQGEKGKVRKQNERRETRT